MNNKKHKARIALFGLGTLGGEPMGQGIPVIKDLFERLTKDFDITFYSFKAIDRTRIDPAIDVKEAVSWPFLPGRIKFMSVAAMFILDHIRNPYDLIFSVSIYPTGQWAVFLGRLMKLPVVVQIIAFEVVNETNKIRGDLMRPWLKQITQHVCERATALVAVAEYQKKVAFESLPITREIDVLPLRINPEKFPHRHRIIGSLVRFIHVGYYSIVKDQDTMFAGFARVAGEINCHLTIIGKGFDTPHVQSLLNKLNIQDKVTFVGLVAQHDLPVYYQQADILLHTARYETGCAVIQEAMASGVAVCGTDVGILSDIGDEYAEIVPVCADQLLAEKIMHLVKDPERYRQMTTKAYEWISSHGAIWAYHNYLDFLQRMINGKRK